MNGHSYIAKAFSICRCLPSASGLLGQKSIAIAERVIPWKMKIPGKPGPGSLAQRQNQ